MSKKDQPYLAEGSTYRLDLGKVAGSLVKAVHGYVSQEFGDPVFKLSRIVLQDGREFSCEGEHDMPYVHPFKTDAAWDERLEDLSADEETGGEEE